MLRIIKPFYSAWWLHRLRRLRGYMVTLRLHGLHRLRGFRGKVTVHGEWEEFYRLKFHVAYLGEEVQNKVMS
mgnify:CR=1 FL=1